MSVSPRSENCCGCHATDYFCQECCGCFTPEVDRLTRRVGVLEDALSTLVNAFNSQMILKLEPSVKQKGSSVIEAMNKAVQALAAEVKP